MNAPVADIHNDEKFESEAQLLGALLAYGDGALVRQAQAIIGPEQFSDLFNARLFAIIGRGVDAGLHAFKLTHWIIHQLHDDATIKELKVTPSALVANYIAGAVPAIGVEGCARQIRHDWLNVKLKIAVEDGDTAEAEAAAAEMERLSTAHLKTSDAMQSIGSAADAVLTKINEAIMNGAAPKDYAWPGSLDLHSAISGWRRKRFYVIAGRPGMGKTTAALSLLLGTAAKGHGVMFFSLEMGRDELSEMALCNLAWKGSRRIEYRDLAEARVTSDGFARKFEDILQVAPVLNSMPLVISDQAGQTVAQIRSSAQTYAQRLAVNGQRLEVICIDHLNLIAPSASYKGNKAAETEEISMSLKQLAKELDCAVISLVQLNRAVEGREDKRPGLSDLRWSGAIEQDADAVMFVYREAYYLERKKFDDMNQETERQETLARKKNNLELIFAKHRGGPCPVLDYFCDMGCAVIRDLDR